MLLVKIGTKGKSESNGRHRACSALAQSQKVLLMSACSRGAPLDRILRIPGALSLEHGSLSLQAPPRALPPHPTSQVTTGVPR